MNNWSKTPAGMCVLFTLIGLFSMGIWAGLERYSEVQERKARQQTGVVHSTTTNTNENQTIKP